MQSSEPAMKLNIYRALVKFLTTTRDRAKTGLAHASPL